MSENIDTLQARADRLRERAKQEYPESWVPDQAGDEIAGELVRYSRGTTSYGEQVIAVLRTPEGVERSVWLLHAVLRGEFAKLRPKPGELVLIRYEGKRKSAAGNSYVSYRVEVGRDEPAPDWEALGAEPMPEPAEPISPAAPVEPRSDDGDIPF
jgi:hypothetical protein